MSLLPPANEVAEGYVFTPVCHSVHGGGHAWHRGVHGRGVLGGVSVSGPMFLLGGLCPGGLPDRDPLDRDPPPLYGKERAVRILLESRMHSCI